MDSRMKWLAEDKIAHRGYHNSRYPENSMGAFKRAIDHGFSIELDIHMLSDGEIVVYHDDNLKRVTGVDKDIEKCTYEEIKNLKLLDSNENIPLFKDVLNEVNGKVGIMIELKTRGKAGPLEEKTYEMLKNYKGRYIIQSFNPFSVAWFYKNAPEIVRGQLSGYFKDDDLSLVSRVLLRNYLLNFLSKPDFINYDINYLHRLPIKLIRCKGKFVFGWTARSKTEFCDALNRCENAVFEDFNPCE
ncbi:glycerophosphodiester phosphodiesterase family protein [Vallitalea guaymasensis]|uniref:Glycerophosphodiester phosphodiesterase n=2 Tax=Vallitalea guaymasensis TaxID=1185412 RepID=A0A8J8SDS6_9FIRM|nr:glycerophosphodiester phosphodiesterase family protein [Vallitalea guaymasensis]QUH30820.1 glycerophosphodiester phosphodiesterase [Vallitalea guaymasensis]